MAHSSRNTWFLVTVINVDKQQWIEVIAKLRISLLLLFKLDIVINVCIYCVYTLLCSWMSCFKKKCNLITVDKQ